MADDGGTPELKPALPEPEFGGGGGGGGFVLVADCDDIIADILARLPVKTLMRFRCVCKPWRALISEPYFVKKHAKKGGKKKLLFSMDPPQTLNYDALENLDLEEEEVDDEFAITELDFRVRIPAYLVKTIVILGSLNGLVCVLVDFMGIVIWNPSTGETSKFLPHPPLERPLSFYGFGYDSTTDDYKIVVGCVNGAFKAHIFALKTGSWKILPRLNDGDYTYIFGRHGYFLNGALHWFMKSFMLRPTIVSFSLERERFEEVPLPSCDSGNWFPNLLIFRSCICLVKEDSRPEYLSVWTMNEYGVAESWTLQFSVYTDPGLDLTPICILENGVILMQKSSYDEFDTKTNSILLINKTTSKTVFEVAGDMRFGSGIYRESLVSVRSTIAGLQN